MQSNQDKSSSGCTLTAGSGQGSVKENSESLVLDSANIKKIEGKTSFHPQTPIRQWEVKHQKLDSQCWKRTQIQKLFQLYDVYGPQWKVLAQNMPLRTANNLKNRFYTVLRNLIKLLFKKMADTCPKLPGEIPSKDLSRLYDAREDYADFGLFVASILRQLDYDLDNGDLATIAQQYSPQIIKIYKILYRDRLSDFKQENLSSRDSHNSPQIVTERLYPQKSTVLNSNQQPIIPIYDGTTTTSPIGFPMEQPNFFYWLMFRPSNIFLP